MNRKGIKQASIVSRMLKEDFIIRISPKEYTLHVKVKSVERATPHIVEE